MHFNRFIGETLVCIVAFRHISCWCSCCYVPRTCY